MTRYYFHVIDGTFSPDFEGVECETMDEVKAEAVRSAGAMLKEQGLRLWNTRRWDMFVTDEQNHTRLKLSFTAEDLS